MTRYGWEVFVPCFGGVIGCAIPHSDSVVETINSLRRDDPVWNQKPRIRALREPVQQYDEEPFHGLHLKYYLPSQWERAKS